MLTNSLMAFFARLFEQVKTFSPFFVFFIFLFFVFSYDYDVELEEPPWHEIYGYGNKIEVALDEVIGKYSIETWGKHANMGYLTANKKFRLRIKELKEKYGSMNQCNVRQHKYMKRDYFITEESYFWRWESECSFEKGRGLAVVDFVIDYSGLKLLRWEIKPI